jgi:hypothetical protein
MLQQHQNKKKGIFKVFVSSAFKDLEKERKEIRKTIDSITLESIGMESFVGWNHLFLLNKIPTKHLLII